MTFTNIVRPAKADNDRNWKIFISYVEGFAIGTELAEQYGLSRSRTHGIYKEIRDMVVDSGQTIPEYKDVMGEWRADTTVAEMVDELAEEFPGGYDQLMRYAVANLHRQYKVTGTLGEHPIVIAG